MSGKVMMVGPGRNGPPGGIRSLVELLVPALKRYLDVLYFPQVQRPRTRNETGVLSCRNLASAITQHARFIVRLCCFRPQIVHVHTSQGLSWLKDTLYIIVSKMCRCRVVLHVHAADFSELYTGHGHFWRRYTRCTMNLADEVIAVSDEWKQLLRQVVPNQKISTFRNCVDAGAFPSWESRPAPRRPVAVFLGMVGDRKGVFDLVDAMGHVKAQRCPLELRIAGDEARRGDLDRVRTRIADLGLEHHCRLLGVVSGRRKTRLLREATLLVLPSYQEGLPLAVIEGMASALPILSTAVGGIPEVVKEGWNGFLVSPGDVEALSRNLRRLAKNPALCKALGRRGRKLVKEELDVKRYVQRLTNLYESLFRPARSH